MKRYIIKQNGNTQCVYADYMRILNENICLFAENTLVASAPTSCIVYEDQMFSVESKEESTKKRNMVNAHCSIIR